MLTTIVLFLVLNGNAAIGPGSLDLRLMDIMPNVDTCNAVIAGVKEYELAHVDGEPIYSKLKCAVIQYKPKEEATEPLVKCAEKHVLGTEVNCNKES